MATCLTERVTAQDFGVAPLDRVLHPVVSQFILEEEGNALRQSVGSIFGLSNLYVQWEVQHPPRNAVTVVNHPKDEQTVDSTATTNHARTCKLLDCNCQLAS